MRVLQLANPPFHGLSDEEKRKYQISKYPDSTTVADDLLAITSEDIPTLTHENNRSLIIFFTFLVPRQQWRYAQSDHDTTKFGYQLSTDHARRLLFQIKLWKVSGRTDYPKRMYFLDADVYTSWNPHKKMKAFMKEAFPSGLYTENGQVVASGIINMSFIDNIFRR